MSLTVGLIAGEASGDALGAGLIAALRQRYPEARFVGVAGPRMQQAGCEAWFDAEELAVMGLVEVLRHLPRLLRLRRRLFKRLLALRPDVVIGIDAPDFNLGLERRLKRQGIATVHYVSPSVWAWRPKRVRLIEAAADQVLCLLPFEPACYAQSRCQAIFVGHPLADQLTPSPDREALRQRLGLATETPVVALLPGSRRGELQRHGELFLQAVQSLQQRMGPLQLLIPAASRQREQQLKDLLQAHGQGLDVQLSCDASIDFLQAADVALVASGTATLETMLIETPMVVAYKMAPLTAWLLRRFGLLRSRFVALPNLIAGKAIVAERLQEEATAERIAKDLHGLLQGAGELQRVEFQRQRDVLRQQADQRAADAVVGLIQRQRQGAA